MGRLAYPKRGAFVSFLRDSPREEEDRPGECGHDGENEEPLDHDDGEDDPGDRERGKQE
jgi:hypothetical protein